MTDSLPPYPGLTTGHAAAHPVITKRGLCDLAPGGQIYPRVPADSMWGSGCVQPWGQTCAKNLSLPLRKAWAHLLPNKTSFQCLLPDQCEMQSRDPTKTSELGEILRLDLTLRDLDPLLN